MTFNATAPAQTYTYDQENRLTGAAGYTYTYDADGNRVRKSNGNLGANGTLYWAMTPGVVAETDLAGTTKSEYIFFDGERVARRDGATGTGGVFYYFSDHLKTASVITDSTGVIKAESDYYPWGGELQFVNNDSNDYKFTGKKRDIETGLDYFGARYYSNGLGRWVSADWSPTPVPVPYADFGDPQSLNLYGFVRNNPISKADLDGHCDPVGCVMHAIEYLSGHTGYIGIVEGNVRAGYNARVAEKKANQGGQITSEQRAAIQQEARQGSTALGKSVAEAHDIQTAAAKAAKTADQMAESAGRTNPGFNMAGKVAKVGGPVLTAVAVGIAAKNVANAPEGQKLSTAAKEGGGISGAIAGGELGAELLSPVAPPFGAIGGGIIGAVGGGFVGKGAVEGVLNNPQKTPNIDNSGCSHGSGPSCR